MFPSRVRGKRVLLGVSGGISAYKIPDLVRIYTRAGCEVEVIMTEMAARMVSPLAVATLTGRRVWRDADMSSDDRGWMIPHVRLAEWADIFVVAPATANTLRAADSGDSSTLLGATMLVYGGRDNGRAPMLFFAAMNDKMWQSEPTRANASRLSSISGHTVFEPELGPLACGADGRGRMPSPEDIAFSTWSGLCDRRGRDGRPEFFGKRFLITAGPTREYIDPVRFISNPSTGQMGVALASEALWRGADVSLVMGPCETPPPPGAEVTHVTTAMEMHDACLTRLSSADVIIKAAAVGDFRAAEYTPHKIKRGSRSEMTLDLVRTEDIAADLSRRRAQGQFIAAFAAETEALLDNARLKIDQKGLDMIVANNISEEGAGFAVETNRVVIVDSFRRGGGTERLEGSKIDVAAGILDHIARLLESNVVEEADLIVEVP